MQCCNSFVLVFFFSKVDGGARDSSAHFDDLIFKNSVSNLSPFAPVHDSHLIVWVCERVRELAHKRSWNNPDYKPEVTSSRLDKISVGCGCNFNRKPLRACELLAIVGQLWSIGQWSNFGSHRSNKREGLEEELVARRLSPELPAWPSSAQGTR